MTDVYMNLHSPINRNVEKEEKNFTSNDLQFLEKDEDEEIEVID